MAVLGYTLVSILLILIQTALLPQIPMRPPLDLLVVQVVFTALSLPGLKGGAVIVMTGLLADGLSGSPFGLYITSYFWLFLSLQIATQVLHVYSRILIYLAILAGILFENLVALLALTVSGANPSTMMWAVEQGGRQLLWGAVLGPTVYALLGVGYRLGGLLAQGVGRSLEGGDGV
jgi:cell shape-determining protein MreD